MTGSWIRFPPAQQAQVRVQLSMVLRVGDLPAAAAGDVNGSMVPAFELMHMNSAIRSMIRDSKNHQIDSVIQTAANEGMFTMDQSILKLWQEGRIAPETAVDYADNPEQMRRRMK